MHTYSCTKILKFYKFRTFGVFYENLQYILLLKNFNIKIQYQKFKEYIMSLRLAFVVTRGHSWWLVVTRVYF